MKIFIGDTLFSAINYLIMDIFTNVTFQNVLSIKEDSLESNYFLTVKMWLYQNRYFCKGKICNSSLTLTTHNICEVFPCAMQGFPSKYLLFQNT